MYVFQITLKFGKPLISSTAKLDKNQSDVEILAAISRVRGFTGYHDKTIYRRYKWPTGHICFICSRLGTSSELALANHQSVTKCNTPPPPPPPPPHTHTHTHTRLSITQVIQVITWFWKLLQWRCMVLNHFTIDCLFSIFAKLTTNSNALRVPCVEKLHRDSTQMTNDAEIVSV